jgi:hypothetical protein
MSEVSRVSRRTALTGAAAMAGVGAVGAFTATAKAAGDPGANATTVGPLHVKKQFMLIDKNSRQRFLMQSTKPPVILNGQTIPADQRGGPDDGSYFIFNDENENEKGGITVSSGGGLLSFDYPNIDAMHLQVIIAGALGGSVLTMREMPDPTLPPTEIPPETAATRIQLATANDGTGAALLLSDSHGNPRILLQVDGDDNAFLLFLDADGNVVAQFPPAEGAAATRAKPKLSKLLQGELG